MKKMKEDVKRFVYYNRNPNGYHKKDCVCKAISTATGLKYNAVNKLLDMTAKYGNCDKLCVCCYHKLLEDLLEYPVVFCYKGETVEDIAQTFDNCILIIRIKGHLTCSIFGKIPDIWDCSNEIVDCFWVCN